MYDRLISFVVIWIKEFLVVRTPGYSDDIFRDYHLPKCPRAPSPHKKLHAFLFKRINFIRMLRLKIVENLRMP